MATDTTDNENSSNNHSTEEESSSSITRSPDSVQDNSKDDITSKLKSEIPKIKKSVEDTDSEENTSEFVVSDPMHIEVSHNDGVSENAVTNNNFKNSVLDIHNIQILEDPLDNNNSMKIVEETISISDCSNSDRSSNDDEDTTKNCVSKDSSIIINDDVLDSSSINLKPASVMVLNPKTNFGDKQILNNDLLKGQRVFILNGNVISRDEAEKTKPDNINIICVSNNLNDLITGMKHDTLKTSCAVTPSETKDKGSMLKNLQQSGIIPKTTNVPKFIQLTQSNYKSISPKINASTGITTPPITIPKMIAPKLPAPSATKGSGEILRLKLTETDSMLHNQNQSLDISGAKKTNSSGVTKKDTEPESSAVAKARSEFNKCRKKLIEAAIHPQLPTYKPPATYEGPIFTCEECDDTFSSIGSLKTHKNRRSVLFTYNCPSCNCTLEFYNRCTFLLHVRSHDTAVKACYLTISTIPSDKLNFKLLQPDEVESPTVHSFDRPVHRIRDRVIQRKSSEESHELTHKVESIENGTDTLKTIQLAEQNNSRNFDLIKSFNKNKFEAYLKNTNHKKFPQKNSIDKKSDSESALSDDSTDDENDSNTSQDVTVNDISSLNGSTNTSQLKYFLTTIHQTSTPITLKRPTENGSQNTEETANKKLKVNEEPIDVDSLPEPEPVLPKIKHTPIIIRTKTSPTKPQSTVEKFADEITLTSSDDEDDSEEESTTEDSKSVVCRECKVDVVNLSKHIRAENKPLKEFLCEHCKFFSPSKCALQAHIRMHAKAQPYICPDCGFYFNTFDTFQTHVKQVCYYDFKAIRFECPECALLKPSVQAFADHLKRCHTRDVFKCSLCITSSYSTKVVDIHIKKKHEGEEGAVLEGYRCMLCPNILISKKSISTHINKHVFSLKHLRYVYICKRCKKYASGKRKKFVRHLSECDPKKKESIVVQQIENIVVKPKDTKEKMPKSTSTKSTNTKSSRSRPSKSPGKKEGGREAGDADKDPLSIESWEADKLKAQFVPKTKICFMCRSADISSRSNSLFCNACVCSVNADDTSESSEGARHDSGRPKRKFKCRLCKQLMNKDWATITKHYETNHYSDFKVKSETRSRQLKDKDKEKDKETDNKKFDNATSVSIVKKRRLSAKDTPLAKSQKIEEKSEPEPELELYSPGHSNSYECVHCNFQSEDHDEFKIHIIAHKDPNNTQCPECGQCFMVDASLAKHLLIVHHVRNLRRYFFENDLFKKDEPIERVKNLKDHQCDVCLMQCDSKQSYDKHLRTHGMAFVALQSRNKGEKPRCGLVRI